MPLNPIVLAWRFFFGGEGYKTVHNLFPKELTSSATENRKFDLKGILKNSGGSGLWEEFGRFSGDI